MPSGQSLSDLIHELVTVDPQTEDVDPEHQIVAQDKRIHAQIVVSHREPPTVARPVDLHHKPELLPAHVEVDAAACTLDNDLPGGLGQATAAAHQGEVELAERLCSPGKIPDDQRDQPSTATAWSDAVRSCELAGVDQPLLHSHGEDQDSLTI